jgi:FtsH-binding integral membrane protein
MSMHLLSREHEHSEARPSAALDHATSHAITSAILRTTGIVLLMSLAVIHIVQLVPTFQQTPLLGVGYLFVIAAAVVVGARLVKGHPSAVQLWLPVAALGVAVFVGYAFTRVLSTPLDNQDVGNWACTLGLAALFVVGLMMAIAAYAISHGRRLMLAPASTRSGAAHSASGGDEATRRESAAWN